MKVSGNKAELIARLEGKSTPDTPTKKRQVANGEEPAKKRRPTKNSFPGFSDNDISNTKPDEVRKNFTRQAKELYHMVDDDWHDGYEDQQEYVARYCVEIGVPLQSAVNISLQALKQEFSEKAADIYERAHETLFSVADSWKNFLSIPLRGSILEYVSGCKITLPHATLEFDSMQEYLSYVWQVLLLAAASSGKVDVENMRRFIKDASDYSGSGILPGDESEEEQKNERSLSKLEFFQRGIEALRVVHDDDEWKQLPSKMKQYKSKRVADSRFETPFHRRKKEGNRSRSRDDFDY